MLLQLLLQVFSVAACFHRRGHFSSQPLSLTRFIGFMAFLSAPSNLPLNRQHDNNDHIPAAAGDEEGPHTHQQIISNVCSPITWGYLEQSQMVEEVLQLRMWKTFGGPATNLLTPLYRPLQGCSSYHVCTVTPEPVSELSGTSVDSRTTSDLFEGH